MIDTTDFYFQSYSEWHKAITERCKIDLTPEYVRSRISALQNPKDKSTQEFKLKYGELLNPPSNDISLLYLYIKKLFVKNGI